MEGKSQEIADSVFLQQPDTIINVETNNIVSESIIDTLKIDTISSVKFQPDPVKAIWMGAIVPGYGQIVNKKYWKLPFVYGGFLGFAYAISWNNSRYTSYKNAYRDIIDDDPATNSHIDILPKGYTIDTFPGGITAYEKALKTKQDYFRRYRDLSIILSVGYYGLVLLEAYVDAHLYNFDISPDLVLNILPSRIQLMNDSRSAYGLQCSLNF